MPCPSAVHNRAFQAVAHLTPLKMTVHEKHSKSFNQDMYTCNKFIELLLRDYLCTCINKIIFGIS